MSRDRFSSITFAGGSINAEPMPGLSLPSYIGSALEAAVRDLVLELAPIRLNVVAPGFTDAVRRGEMREKLTKEQGSRVLTGVVGQAEDVAKAYLYLSKDANTTGQVIKSEVVPF